jgi:UDP-glucuronate 4-epimerase
MTRALVTGGAGFIGSHLTDGLLCDGWDVTVLDNLDPFYDPAIKLANLRQHRGNPRLHFVEGDIRDIDDLRKRLTGRYDVIVHLAAKAGVRPSIADPIAYEQVNVAGTQVMLELAKEWNTEQFVFASSSSVYGVNPNVPWSEEDHGLMPISPYASTKLSGELLGHVYSHLYGMRFIGLRFFTVYGPRQRPDLAIHKFARLLGSGACVPIFGDGTMSRDFTYIDDIIRGVRAAMDYSGSDYEIINLGNHRGVSVMEMVETLAEALGIEPALTFFPEQPGDVPQTYADIAKAKRLLGYEPATSFAEGIDRFVDWFRKTRTTECRTSSAAQAPTSHSISTLALKP